LWPVLVGSSAATKPQLQRARRCRGINSALTGVHNNTARQGLAVLLPLRISEVLQRVIQSHREIFDLDDAIRDWRIKILSSNAVVFDRIQLTGNEKKLFKRRSERPDAGDPGKRR
jgi:hypothetical protein